MPSTDTRDLAKEIAADLFTNGLGQHARRLVLELENGHNGGGWCERAVVDRIRGHLASPPASEAGQPLKHPEAACRNARIGNSAASPDPSAEVVGPVQAVAFAFLRGAEVLMERCPKKARIHDGEWFIPGGRIEAGETAEQALYREVYEELGVSVHDCDPLPLVDAHGWDERGPFLMRPFVVTAWHGELPDHCRDHPDVPLRWVPFSEALASPVRAVRSILAQLPQTNRWIPGATEKTWDRVRDLLMMLGRRDLTELTVEARLREIFGPGAREEGSCTSR